MVGKRRHRASVIDSEQARAKLSDAQIDAFADFDKLHLDSKDSIALTTMKLDYYYGLVKRQLLRFQDPRTGLFPAFSNDQVTGSVRDSIYCCMALWSLHRAYKRVDSDKGKSYELSQSAVLGMRGILICWMRQRDKVERFKSKQHPEHALHVKFSLQDGAEICSYQDYGHLQIDVVSLFLLTLCQFLQTDVQLIQTMDEVHFIQNLIFCVERAYRTPDYGMWGRGSKYNNNTPEVNASSLGLAKAALEAVNGQNMFGTRGAHWSVVYADIDAHNRNRSIFETLLPRESATKNIDAALLPTISWPAFATHDERLYDATKMKIIERLEGKYGFVRFKRDGYQCPLEPTNSRFYPEGTVHEFEGIECQWPIFYCFLIIDGVFKHNFEQVEKYQVALKTRLYYNDRGDPMLPRLFKVGANNVTAEKKNPGSTRRFASEEGSTPGCLYLMGQALLIITELLTSSLLLDHELDPIRRFLPSFDRPKTGSRYSAFEGNASDSVVQVVLMAQSLRLQTMLATYGIGTQTPQEIEPTQIWCQANMVKILSHLGKCERLGLSGRPSRPIGSLGTSKVYRVASNNVICYPLIFSASDFYLSHDMALLTDDIKTELKFVSRNWRLAGRPTVVIPITEDYMRDEDFPTMLELLGKLKDGSIDDVQVNVGRVQNLMSSSCVEHLGFLQQANVDMDEMGMVPFKQLQHTRHGYQSLTDIPKVTKVYDPDRDFISQFQNATTDEICSTLRHLEHKMGRIQLLGILLHRADVGGEYKVDGDRTVLNLLKQESDLAGKNRNWQAVRYSSSLLRRLVDSISPYVTQILVNGKQVTVGTIGENYTVFSKPMTPEEIHNAIYTCVQPHNINAAVIQQELILYNGKLIGTNPELYRGVLKIRMGWVMRAIEIYQSVREEFPLPLEKLPPSKIRKLLVRMMEETVPKDQAKESSQAATPAEETKAANSVNREDRPLTVYERRQINGCLMRVPDRFYTNIWTILERAPQGINFGQGMLKPQPTLTTMTSTESAFAHMVEDRFAHFSEPEHRQIVVELFCVMATILSRNPELMFHEEINVDLLVKNAIAMFEKDLGLTDDAHESFYRARLATTSSYLGRAVVNSLLKESTGKQFAEDDKALESCNMQ